MALERKDPENQLILTVNEMTSRLNVGEQVDVLSLSFQKCSTKFHTTDTSGGFTSYKCRV